MTPVAFLPTRIVRGLIGAALVGCLMGSHVLLAADTPAPRIITALQKSGTVVNFMAIHFRDASLGWAVGASGTILKTSTGGKRWKAVPSGTTALLTGIFFADRQQGWVVGANGTILHSSDGGEKWRPQEGDRKSVV